MRLGFILREAVKGLRQNVVMVVSVVLVTFVSLTFVGASALLQLQINQMKGYWYDRMEVAVYLCDDTSASPNCAGKPVTDDQRNSIKAMLESEQLAPYVKEIAYESKEDAYKNFLDQYKNSSLVDQVKADQLPESFRVALVDPEKYQVINEAFSTVAGVDSVVDQRELLEKVFQLVRVASAAAAIVAIVMIACAVLLTGTTIQLSAMHRRLETTIMRLVGASKATIQLPFIIEGVIASIIGGVLASGTLWLLMKFLVEDKLASENVGVAFISTGEVWLIAPVLLIIGIVLATISSVVTLKRYLKV
ncbi:permease-like cell division protein FtsX [Glutamicibacter soli]|uniref:Cell division protein FtsX n=1 Tax=Glutamicibacter soli TaxID=453836 RepID=A0A365Y9N1_9MICC|nr:MULTISPECIES: permease-like cell division protein FtsX [Micrococcaceae]ALD63520.1 cell division protein FtsX [Arthrobacter sp. LS16]ALQ31210.1 cell division protein FtsX [Arthrobacter sp. YC-RL1]KLI87531.1 cell division protein FtsX [Arthrobacter sp. YC-RL1]RBL99404.1 ABC transporter permease [Glutamicibacter soli]RKS19310.1 cell division protein FtsX [Arthrobacter sp. AG1021]